MDILTEKIKPLSDSSIRMIKSHWDNVAKPLDSLGEFENIICRIGAIKNSDDVSIAKRAVIVYCADNGIVSEGVTQSGTEVTAISARDIAEGHHNVNQMARVAGCDVMAVDIGVKDRDIIDGCSALIARNVRHGTRDFLKEPAMTAAETLQAIETGRNIAHKCHEKGYNIIAVGEMGIGNTTTSSAVTASLLHLPASDVTGRGAGLSDSGLKRKISVIDEAVKKYRLYDADAFTVLSTVGGLDIAAMCGTFFGAYECGLPVVLDGIVSLSAALAAEGIWPGISSYLIPSHRGREAVCGLVLDHLGMKAVLSADLALGEGTGAVLMFPMLDEILAVYNEANSFAQINIDGYRRFRQ